MTLEDFQLNGKVALVTGAAQGLGEALAVGLAEAGADIIALDRLPVETCLEHIRARRPQVYLHSGHRQRLEEWAGLQ